MRTETVDLDALIFGGGVAGLWTLDELIRRGFAAALVETQTLGAGQTICSQGILHGGLKYALTGAITDSTKSVRDMPALWAACMKGERAPDLRGVRILSPHCYLWRTDSITSRIGLWGARVGLRTPVERIPDGDRPALLARCPGPVFRVNEPVIDAASFLSVLSLRHQARLLHVNDANSTAFSSSAPGRIDVVELTNAKTRATTRIRPRWIILTAGEGNAGLRRAVGLDTESMQRRPLHMVMVRGTMPALFGHCVDGNKTRLTITTNHDRTGRTVWHIGGEVAEKGVPCDTGAQLAAARRELNAVVPGLDLKGVEWACYRVDRAEGRTAEGRRPDGPQSRVEGNVLTAWPTKLVLAPRLAETIADQLGEPVVKQAVLPDWPRPAVSDPPWEVTQEWHS